MSDQSLQVRLADSSNPVLWTHRLGGLVGMAQVLEEHGVELGPLLAAVGLPPDALSSPDNRVPFAALPRLLELAVEATGCEHLGLIIGDRWRHFDESGAMTRRARCSSTLGEALERLTLFQRLNSQGVTAYLLRHGGTVTLGVAVFRPGATELACVYDLSLASLVGGVREFVGREDWSPDQVLLPRARPRDDAAYRRFFGQRVEFDSDQACFRFPAALMSKAMAHPDPALARTLDAMMLRALDEHLLPQVYRSLRLLLLDGAVTGDGVAQHLSLHRRTLDRRLRELGTSFHAILDEVRLDIARQLLAETQLPLSTIATTIGYSEASSLVRAFRQWTGTSPMRWRSKHRSPPAANSPEAPTGLQLGTTLARPAVAG